MKSHSNAGPVAVPGEKWKWSIVPTRAFADHRVSPGELRILGAICAFVNRAGVCWPSMMTIAELAGLAQRQSVHKAVKRLKALGYLRQLEAKDYQTTASGWKGNRYQVLWNGDEPPPSKEDLHIPRALTPPEGGNRLPEETGGLGGDAALSAISHTLARAYAATLERRTGQARNIANEINTARRLAEKGVTVQQVTEATEALCRAAIERRGGLPFLADVARHLNAAP